VDTLIFTKSDYIHKLWLHWPEIFEIFIFWKLLLFCNYSKCLFICFLFKQNLISNYFSFLIFFSSKFLHFYFFLEIFLFFFNFCLFISFFIFLFKILSFRRSHQIPIKIIILHIYSQYFFHKINYSKKCD